MSGWETNIEQERALQELEELFVACENITADFHTWFFPSSRAKSIAKTTRLVNKITYVLREPAHKLPETSDPALRAQQIIVSTYLSLVSEGEEKIKLTEMLVKISSPLTARFPAWDAFIGSLNSLNTPNRAYPFVTGLKTTAEVLSSPAEKESFKPSLWSLIRSFMDGLKHFFFTPSDPDPCEVNFVSPQELPPPAEKPSAKFNRAFREPGETVAEREKRLGAQNKFK